MEEILVVVFQVLLEFVVQLVVYIGLDLGWLWRDDQLDHGCFYILVFLILGSLLGAAMNGMHPALLTPGPALQIAGLILWPVSAGSIGCLLAGALNKRGWAVSTKMHFVSAFCFVLAFNVVRFLFGAR